ncbi:DUF4258 domain-containing protein [Methanospirillum sp.]|uniref:DUF4258 domain-containing protein n=1 Tax=Methanospirillum sp. TaxID=45200 RepID=UPI00359FE7FF
MGLFPDNNFYVEWRIHALQQMITRNISRKDVLDIVHSGEIIESYLNDLPYPSFLIMGSSQRRPLHVVVAHAEEINTIYVITAYEPDKLKWDERFRRRK